MWGKAFFKFKFPYLLIFFVLFCSGVFCIKNRNVFLALDKTVFKLLVCLLDTIRKICCNCKLFLWRFWTQCVLLLLQNRFGINVPFATSFHLYRLWTCSTCSSLMETHFCPLPAAMMSCIMKSFACTRILTTFILWVSTSWLVRTAAAWKWGWWKRDVCVKCFLSTCYWCVLCWVNMFCVLGHVGKLRIERGINLLKGYIFFNFTKKYK